MTIRQTFDSLKRQNESALVVYVMAGYPSLEHSMNLIQQCCVNGADLIEIGIPFSDPIADGPTIQHAGTEALRRGVTLRDVLHAVEKIRTDKPLILMSYLNPLLSYGTDRLFEGMNRAGFSGLIVPDLPVEESADWVPSAIKNDIDTIFLVTPISGTERIRRIASLSKGFLYCVSLAGTTGSRPELSADLGKFLSDVRGVTGSLGTTGLPVVVGFGISTPAQIRILNNQADGVVVGSRIIEAIRKGEDVPSLVRELKHATKKESEQ